MGLFNLSRVAFVGSFLMGGEVEAGEIFMSVAARGREFAKAIAVWKIEFVRVRSREWGGYRRRRSGYRVAS